MKYKIWVDEAGRGPWAGPVVAAAFCFDSNNSISKDIVSQINDSKKLTAKKREGLYAILVEKGLFWVGVVDNYIIDEINIRQANKEAMRRAIIELKRKLPDQTTWKKTQFEVMIDGRDNYVFDELKAQPTYIIWGDWKVTEIGAASIIAKVFRDKLMSAYATLYPNLGFETNQWYWTKKHQENLLNPADITGIHRTTYKPVQVVVTKREKTSKNK